MLPPWQMQVLDDQDGSFAHVCVHLCQTEAEATVERFCNDVAVLCLCIVWGAYWACSCMLMAVSVDLLHEVGTLHLYKIRNMCLPGSTPEAYKPHSSAMQACAEDCCFATQECNRLSSQHPHLCCVWHHHCWKALHRPSGRQSTCFDSF